MGYIVVPIGHDKMYDSIKEAKQAALEAAVDGRTYAVTKVIGITKSNPIFVKYKDPSPSELNISVPINAKCDFDGNPAVASKISATGDLVYLCLSCVGETNGK